MTAKQFLVAVVLVCIIAAAHMWLQLQLVSVAIAPIVIAIWLGLTPDPPEWSIIIFAIVGELFSGAPPGAMAAVILLPLLTRTVLPAIVPGITLTFFLFIVGLVVLQIAILSASFLSGIKSVNVPWYPGLLAVLGTTLLAFIIVNAWYEFGVERKQ